MLTTKDPLKLGLINVNNGNVCPEDSSGSNISQYTALSYRWQVPEGGLLSREFLDGMVDKIFDDWKTVWEVEERYLSLLSDKGFHNDLRLGKLAAVDEQSYGKSSMFEDVTGILFPRNEHSVTTCKRHFARRPSQLWVDSCCVDMKSSTELTKASNCTSCHHQLGRERDRLLFEGADPVRNQHDCYPAVNPGNTLRKRYWNRMLESTTRDSWTWNADLKPENILQSSNSTKLLHGTIRDLFVQQDPTLSFSRAIATHSHHPKLLEMITSDIAERKEVTWVMRKDCASHPESPQVMKRFDLIDTPGFNDIRRSDMDVLKVLGDWLARSTKLARKWIVQEQSALLENLSMFRELCDNNILDSVILATTCWTEQGTTRKKDVSRVGLEDWEHAMISQQPLNTFSLLQGVIFTLLSQLGIVLPKPFNHELYLHRRHCQKDERILPEALDRTTTKISRGFIGDEGIGPLAGKPSMGREDDDDDDCVGFRNLSAPASQGSALHYERAGQYGGASVQGLQVSDLRGAVPKYGPPKRDPVAAAISTPLIHLTRESTLNMWRGAIARTCATGTEPNAEKWKCCPCKCGYCDMYRCAHSRGGLLSAH